MNTALIALVFFGLILAFALRKNAFVIGMARFGFSLLGLLVLAIPAMLRVGKRAKPAQTSFA